MVKDIIDLDDALERVENDAELLVELLDVFLEDCPLKLQAMRQMAQQKDFSQLKDLAHSMKGASGNISAKKMREIFLKIEGMAEESDITAIDVCFKELDGQLADLKEYCAQLKKKLAD